MKKIVRTLTVAMIAVVLCFALTACSGVEGKTYVFDKAEIVGELPEEMKESYSLDDLKANFEKTQFKFEAEGKYSTSNDGGEKWEEAKGTYKFENKEVKFLDEDGEENATMKQEGGKLIMEEEIVEGVSMKITFKKK